MEETKEKKKAKKKSSSHKKKENIFYGTGRRKRAIARVYLVLGDGQRMVNGKDVREYFCGREVLLKLVEVPFNAVSAPAFNLRAKVYGGGIPAQADAIRMGIARALIEFNPDFRKTLRSLDLLKRDPREKERKKAGLKRARKAFQFTKR